MPMLAPPVRGKIRMARIFALPVTLLALAMAVWAADQSAGNVRGTRFIRCQAILKKPLG